MEVNRIKKRVVGIDISIDRTICAIVDNRGNIIASESFRTSDYPDVTQFVKVLGNKILELTEANGGYENIRSVGVIAPSANSITGYIENASNLPWRGSIPLAVMLREHIGIAVGLSNDAHGSALGEYVFGHAHGMRNFIVVSLGVGVGSCFYSEGNEHKGYLGCAGEFGHIPVGNEGRSCGCGHNDCLETYVGARGIVVTAQRLMAASDAPSLMRDEESLTAKRIFEFCERGDKLAIETFMKTGDMLGRGLAIYASLVDPEAIILTGGVSRAGHWLLDPARESFEYHVFHNMRNKVKIFCSSIDNHDRDVLGASVVAWSVPQYSLFK
jgi:glucokinase